MLELSETTLYKHLQNLEKKIKDLFEKYKKLDKSKRWFKEPVGIYSGYEDRFFFKKSQECGM